MTASLHCGDIGLQQFNLSRQWIAQRLLSRIWSFSDYPLSASSMPDHKDISIAQQGIVATE
jgi:hypothetical protein